MSYAEIPRPIKRMLADLADAWWQATLRSTLAPAGEAAFQRARAIEPGDIVMESSTLYMLRSKNDLADDRWDGQFTRYLRTDVRHGTLDDDWSETVHVCENPDGSEFAWTNAELIALPMAFYAAVSADAAS